MTEGGADKRPEDMSLSTMKTRQKASTTPKPTAPCLKDLKNVQ
jgi:hypothetical protein